MGKSLFIAEKPSVAQQFAATLGESMTRYDGYQESENLVVTWCLGHLVTMSYPDAYDPSLKKWSLNTLPFIPQEYKYEIIPSARKQFQVVKKLLTRKDVDRIYVCTDSGREGEYIYRLVRQQAGVKDKEERRVWIDSQTEEEIRRGIREAKPISAYDDLAASAYLRAQEDYLMGINFSRALTLRYGNSMAAYLGERYCVISVGRVMTCVLGMVVSREREIRNFQETPFYRVFMNILLDGARIPLEWRAVEGSRFFQSPKLYAANGFREKKDAEELIRFLQETGLSEATVFSAERKNEKKNPPLLYNLAELQNDCSRMFKISPDQTLNIVQDLYEKKLVTYPRTDARVLSSAIAREISKNITGLKNFGPASSFAQEALDLGKWKSIGSTKYTDDKQITDHYALIPTGQGLGALKGLNSLSYGVYCQIVKRFLSIFYPPAVYKKTALVLEKNGEKFFASFRTLQEEGYLAVMKAPEKEAPASEDRAPDEAFREPGIRTSSDSGAGKGPSEGGSDNIDLKDPGVLASLARLRKGTVLPVSSFDIRIGRTSPPKRYNSGSMILAMENAGNLIEDDELREQIRSTGIGTSATRAEILKKLVSNRYLALNSRTQVLTPTLFGEMIYDVVRSSIRSLLDPALTASWEKGLGYVADGSVTPEEYTAKMNGYVSKWTNYVKDIRNESQMVVLYNQSARFYKARTATGRQGRGDGARKGGPRRSSGKNRKQEQ